MSINHNISILNLTIKKITTDAPTAANFVEVRRHVRHAYGGQVYTNSGLTECGALDISAGGVGLLVPEQLEVGEPLELAFFGRSIAVRGIVRHVTPLTGGDWRIGVGFLREEPELAEVALAPLLESD